MILVGSDKGMQPTAKDTTPMHVAIEKLLAGEKAQLYSKTVTTTQRSTITNHMLAFAGFRLHVAITGKTNGYRNPVDHRGEGRR